MKLDFSGKSREKSRVPNYLGGRDRRNLTFWFLGGGFLLLIATNFANFSSFAKAILPGRSSSIDTRMPLEAYREPLPHGAVQMLPTAEKATVESQQAEAAAQAAPPLTKESPAAPGTNETLPPVAEVKSTMPGHGKYFSGVNAPLLASVKNETLFRQQETEAWFHLFDVVNKAAPEQLKKEATPIYNFATLYGQSNYYRGQAVTMKGLAKWVTEFKSEPPDNAAGIAKYYQIGFQIDSREVNPIAVYVIDLPENLPRGTVDPKDPTRFTFKDGIPFSVAGIFYKNLGYSAGDGFRFMPALVAKSIQLDPAAIAAPPTNPVIYLLVLLGLGGALLLAMYFVSAKRKKVEFVIPSTMPTVSIPEPALHDNLFPDSKSDADSEHKQPWPALPGDE